MKITEKAYAKINLALYVTGKAEGFHTLDSLVTTVDLCDVITLKPRRDKKITVTPQGLSDYVYNHNPKRDNAYKAVEAFMQKHNTFGADVTIKKYIPTSSGMGGSSTDASAVLRALKRAYKIEDDLSDIANSLGSDTAYLLNGGFARLQGKGNVITPLTLKNPLYFVVAFCDEGVDTTLCFKKFDEMQIECKSGAISALIESFNGENPDFSLCENQLYLPAVTINPQIETLFKALKSLSPKSVFMTGSGSAVCAIFETEELCRWAVDKLKKQDINAIVTKSV